MEKIKKEYLSIDESAVFKQLWKKKIFILIVTSLCTVIGIGVIMFRPASYITTLNVIFENAPIGYTQSFISYGKINFSDYSKTGKIEDGSYLQFSQSEQALLNSFKNKITLGVSNNIVYIQGITVDTLGFEKELKHIGGIIRNRFELLNASFIEQEKGYLNSNIETINNNMERLLRDLIILEDKCRILNDLESRMLVKKAEFEYDLYVSSNTSSLVQFHTNKDLLDKLEISLSPIVFAPDVTHLTARPLLMRWFLFGFIASCIWVLGVQQFMLLLNKRRK